ncbi:alpha-glucosidase [Bifidobacterium sp. H1HS10N]|uniref:alpha-glucosidase n=1 Tax=Bifidobacterium kimbladii TaxID=1293826 RepID=UPI0028BE935F|nr:alpha-glucosidase [Bifidobacterium sp. H1HS10N]MDT7512599.1 alpha-glucosidase [Bifidobacterium sp. H1HS10N]
MSRNWWKECIFYQVYPKSFQDSNGDGKGDLRGIIKRLDYLAWLGIKGLWLSPIFRSPMVDNGYDVSDYYSVDPIFGDNDDLDELIAEAGKRGIRIILDLVVNHCSNKHPWFQRACADPLSEERGYFIIRKKDQLTNWRSNFGGSVWSPMPGSPDDYYMHVFAKEQPDLNWENPLLRHKIYRMINYWLDKGIAGFRIDAITYLKKDQAFPILPPDGHDGLVAVTKAANNQPGIEVFLKEMREETFDRHPGCVTVAEASDVPFNQLPEYSGPDGFFSMIFEFSYQDPYVDPVHPEWFRPKSWDVEEYKQKIQDAQVQQQKLGVWSPTHLENHDSPRALTRLMANKQVGGVSADSQMRRRQATMLAAMYFFLRGTPFIYQGQELGMSNSTLTKIEQFNDIMTRDQYQEAIQQGLDPQDAFDKVAFRSRDNSRTPMQWNKGKNAGFSPSEPWLPVNSDFQMINVQEESDDKKSVLSFYRAMIGLRSNPIYCKTLVYGTSKPAYADKTNVIAYDRSYNGQIIRVVCNFQYGQSHLGKTSGLSDGDILMTNLGRENLNGDVILGPFEALVVLLKQAA